MTLFKSGEYSPTANVTDYRLPHEQLEIALRTPKPRRCHPVSTKKDARIGGRRCVDDPGIGSPRKMNQFDA